MTTMTTHPIYQAVATYLDWVDANPPGQRDHTTYPPRGHVYVPGASHGVSFYLDHHVDHVSSMPGGLPLLIRGCPPNHPDFFLIGLDLAHDLRDARVREMRDPIVAVLTDRDIPFLPVSFAALNNTRDLLGVHGWGEVELVDRDGLQCVFALRGAYFISGYDANEDPPLYFMARLPGPVTTYRAAIESLKPRSVKLAEYQGLKVLRQGDMFAIPTTFATHDLRAMGAEFGTNISREIPAPRNPLDSMRRTAILISSWTEVFAGEPAEPAPEPPKTMTDTRRRGLYGTAHTATELAYLPDGTMFARGAIVHDPRHVLREHRNPDHGDLRLPGRKWWLVAKNTVPTTSQGRG